MAKIAITDLVNIQSGMSIGFAPGWLQGSMGSSELSNFEYQEAESWNGAAFLRSFNIAKEDPGRGLEKAVNPLRVQ